MKAVRQLRRKVLSGQLATGSMLPSVRELATSTGIGLVTAHKALQAAQDERWASAERGEKRLRVAAEAHAWPALHLRAGARSGGLLGHPD